MRDRDPKEPASVPVIRVLSRAAAPRRGGCPARRRIEADVRAAAARDRFPVPREGPLAPLNAVLDLVEHQGWSLARACAHLPGPGERARRVLGEWIAPAHEGLLAWVRHASRRYLDALDRDRAQDGISRVPVADFWVRQYMPGPGARHTRPYEVCAPGRGYACVAGGGRMRELRVPVMGPARARDCSRAEAAVAAYVLATGTRVDRKAYARRPRRYLEGVPYPMRGRGEDHDSRPPDRVRVLRVSCLDSSTAVLFDGSAAEAEERFASAGREGLRSALAGGARSPGGDCLSCAARSGCGRLPRAPGLLGLDGPPRPRRSWSVSRGLRHRGCPARTHLSALGLARDTRPAPRSERAVRAWLESLHARLPRRPCTIADLPEDQGRWSAAGVSLEGERARRAAAMIAAHTEVCPLRGLVSAGHVRVGHTLAADDTTANVLVLARADVLHHRNRSWIYRTVATRDTADPDPQEPGTVRPGVLDGTRGPAGTGDQDGAEGARLLARHPRLALAVRLFDHGVLPLGARSAVEVEVLGPGGAVLHSLDPESAQVAAQAQRVVRALAQPWYHDLSHPPRPGDCCRDCPHRRWCPAPEVPLGDRCRQTPGT